MVVTTEWEVVAKHPVDRDQGGCLLNILQSQDSPPKPWPLRKNFSVQNVSSVETEKSCL